MLSDQNANYKNYEQKKNIRKMMSKFLLRRRTSENRRAIGASKAQSREAKVKEEMLIGKKKDSEILGGGFRAVRAVFCLLLILSCNMQNAGRSTKKLSLDYAH